MAEYCLWPGESPEINDDHALTEDYPPTQPTAAEGQKFLPNGLPLDATADQEDHRVPRPAIRSRSLAYALPDFYR